MSPILVVQPALSDINFVKMSPHTGDISTMSICHRSEGLEYSVIGKAAYYDLNDESGELLERARSHMLGLARSVFGDFNEKGGGQVHALLQSGCERVSALRHRTGRVCRVEG